ncbi:4b360e55-92d7-440c-ab32-19db7df259de-CDS [Sclerotinia trifoliorum]|uniref:4b360e55-92d7-440c-ab32-19db7df259de-CDS n=1 Tax=Sclerotinia trifoliorum TaxID=28548 RepID=A0A8H2VQK4_9HELO|nr:4b360e55-92d7-440c-ab32-19db7df259de-CDS [Sclerotinia trifoliorum]
MLLCWRIPDYLRSILNCFFFVLLYLIHITSWSQHASKRRFSFGLLIGKHPPIKNAQVQYSAIRNAVTVSLQYDICGSNPNKICKQPHDSAPNITILQI